MVYISLSGSQSGRHFEVMTSKWFRFEIGENQATCGVSGLRVCVYATDMKEEWESRLTRHHCECECNVGMAMMKGHFLHELSRFGVLPPLCWPDFLLLPNHRQLHATQ